MRTIVLINCYFGKFPPYMNLFLESCRKNHTIHFLIYTDCTYEEVPPNVKIVNCSFEELKRRIQSKFEFEIPLPTPYKLCDFKPAYGYIFEEDIKGYDFWGYCDIDLIFGDIRRFLTDNLLGEYDKLYQLGHLTIFRNTKENNIIFMDASDPNYKNAFSTETITVFDEAYGIQKKFAARNKKIYIRRDYIDISPRFYRFKLSDFFIEISPADNNFRHQIFLYKEGHLYRYYLNNGSIEREEFMYIHFQKRDMPQDSNLGNCFFVTYRGFVKCEKEAIDQKDIMTYNKFNMVGQIITTCKYSLWKVKRKINKIRNMRSGK